MIWAVVGLVAGLGVGCTSAPPTATPSDVSPDLVAAWQPVMLPGKLPTRYVWSHKEGRTAVEAVADRSASLWRRRLQLAPEALGHVRFSWWVQDLLPDADVSVAAREDAVARIVLAFDGEHAQLPARDRMLFDLAEALTGERPPYATLMYVYGRQGPVERIVVSARTSRVRKIVIDAGPDRLRQWRLHERDVTADFQRAFGEAPGRLTAVALMTDADNTRGQARTWYGAVDFLAPAR
ncbi:MAG: DUF3047 domain-containing protein [Rubrivivax sp.]